MKSNVGFITLCSLDLTNWSTFFADGKLQNVYLNKVTCKDIGDVPFGCVSLTMVTAEGEEVLKNLTSCDHLELRGCGHGLLRVFERVGRSLVVDLGEEEILHVLGEFGG